MKKLRWFLLLGEMAIFFAGCATIPMASIDLDAAAKTFTPPAGQANRNYSAVLEAFLQGQVHLECSNESIDHRLALLSQR